MLMALRLLTKRIEEMVIGESMNRVKARATKEKTGEEAARNVDKVIRGPKIQGRIGKPARSKRAPKYSRSSRVSPLWGVAIDLGLPTPGRSLTPPPKSLTMRATGE